MLDGWKTYIGGAGFILTGVGSMLMNWYNNNPIGYEENIALIMAGISIIGGRSALKKVEAK